MQTVLTIYGVLFSLVIAAAVIRSGLSRRSDLFTSWNLFLIGSINFVGIAAVQFGRGSSYSQYAIFSTADYLRFMAGATVFYAVAFWVYHRSRLAPRLAYKTFNRWPPQSTGIALMILPIVFVLAMVRFVVPNIQVLGQILFYGAPALLCVSLAMILISWLRNPGNILLFLLFCGILVLGAPLAMAGGTGRREILSVLLCPVIVLYWQRWRYGNRGIILMLGGVIGAGIFVILASYAQFRHEGAREGVSPARMLVQTIANVPNVITNRKVTADSIGGNSVEVSLLAINRYTNPLASLRVETEPFFTLKYIAVNGIPRAWWPDKPEALGQTLPRDLGQWKYGYVNWGPGIVGHGYHEGGIIILICYAWLFASVFRYFDEQLLRHSSNPFVLGIFGGIAGHILAFSRGDIAVFAVTIITNILIVLIVCWLIRVFLGSETSQSASANEQEAPAFAPS